MVSASLARLLQPLGSPHASPMFCCLVGFMLFAAPVVFVAPLRATEVNNTLPAEEETKSASPAGATQHQSRQRARTSSATFMPVLRATCIITSSRARTSAPDGLSEHAHRKGLGTPMRC